MIDKTDLIPVLSNFSPFCYLSGLQLAYVVDAAEVLEAEPGTTLLSAGDEDRDYILLLNGELHVSRSSETGDEQIIGRIKPGEGVGEIALLSAVPRTANVSAAQKSAYLRIEGTRMEEVLGWSQMFKDNLEGDALLRTRINQVRDIEVFRFLPMHLVREAIRCMETEKVKPGDILIQEGSTGDKYYLVVNGKYEISVKGEHMATLGSGAAFGEEALLLDKARNATVKALTDGELLSLEKTHFDRLIKGYKISEVDQADVQVMMMAGGVEILDCRYKSEFDESHLPGAKWFPIENIRLSASMLDPDRDYLIYCRSGRLSASAALLLRENGLRASSLKGGILGWAHELEGTMHSSGS